MPLPDAAISGWMFLSALGVVAVVAFLLPWLLTDVLRAPRWAYLAALMIVTGALTYGYLAWSGTDAVSFVTDNWVWGLIGAIASGGIGIAVIVAAANRRGLPARPAQGVGRMLGMLAWEGLLYGAAEGLLLSTLPVLAAWQAFHALGWTGTVAGSITSGALAIGASVAVIWIHHMGYREFRGNPQIIMPILGCGLLSIAYLLTSSPIAPVGGHFLLHAGMEVRGVPMPPYAKIPGATKAQPRVDQPLRAAA